MNNSSTYLLNYTDIFFIEIAHNEKNAYEISEQMFQ